eukprot:3183860-Pyramimonas_sp.AAC.2
MARYRAGAAAGSAGALAGSGAEGAADELAPPDAFTFYPLAIVAALTRGDYGGSPRRLRGRLIRAALRRRNSFG